MSDVKVNDIVQINEDHEWSGCLAIVSDVKPYGCQAHVEIPMRGKAYIKLEKSEYVKVGEAAWIK